MASRKRPAAPARDFLHDAQLYLFQRAEESSAKNKKTRAGKSVREHVEEHGTVYVDDGGNEITGNIVALFPEPVTIGSKTYYGMELRKKQNIRFDEEAALKLAKGKGFAEEDIGHYEFVLEQDAFYVLNQQGKITDAEIDSLLAEDDPDYSLWPLDKMPAEAADAD